MPTTENMGFTVPDRSEGPTAEQEVEHLAGQCTTLLRENERMRAAIEGIVEWSVSHDDAKRRAQNALKQTV